MKDKCELKEESFRFGIRNNFFTSRTSQAGTQVVQAGCAVSSFEHFQDSNGQSPEQPSLTSCGPFLMELSYDLWI